MIRWCCYSPTPSKNISADCYSPNSLLTMYSLFGTNIVSTHDSWTHSGHQQWRHSQWHSIFCVTTLRTTPPYLICLCEGAVVAAFCFPKYSVYLIPRLPFPSYWDITVRNWCLQKSNSDSPHNFCIVSIILLC